MTKIEILRSSVRPLVTLAFAFAFIGGFFLKLVGPDVFVGIVILVIKYWFDSREEKPEAATARE